MSARALRLALAALLVVLVPGTLGGAAAATTSTTSASDPPPTLNFTEYQELLDEFVEVYSAEGEPIETGVEYEPLFARVDRQAWFGRIRQQMLGVPPSRMSPTARRAWGINFYNYLVIETVANHFYGFSVPVRKDAYVVKDKTRSVQEIRIDGKKFFEAPLVEIEGVRYSLDKFERHFLFDDFDRAGKKPPPSTLDPRIHFALVCAARGCPALMPRVYRPDSLDRQLDFVVRNALATPKHLAWSEAGQTLVGSSIFYWYAADFGGTTGVFEFTRRYAPPEILKRIEEKNLRWVRGPIPWDWDYNIPKAARAASPSGDH